jgi:pimeloyl-ACP methyl ester carboxylesterase
MTIGLLSLKTEVRSSWETVSTPPSSSRREFSTTSSLDNLKSAGAPSTREKLRATSTRIRSGRAPVSSFDSRAEWRTLRFRLRASQGFLLTFLATLTDFMNTFKIPSSASLPNHPELHHLFPHYALANGGSYSPVLLIHGKKDSPIPCTESVKFAKWLEEHGYEHELVLIEGQEHVWDLEENEIAEGGRRKVWDYLDARA